MTQHWIDVSHWQDKMNWSVAAPLIDGAIIKMSEYQEDVQYKANVEGCLKHEVPFAVYHFWHDTMAWKDQIKLIKKLNVHKSPVCLDVEGQSFTYVFAKDSTTALVNLTDAIYDEYGWDATIYTRKLIWDNHILPDTELGECPLWVANYGVNKPAIPRDWKYWHVWQYSNQGKASDYGSPVKFIDLNQVKMNWLNYYWPASTPPEPPAPPADVVQETIIITINDKQYTWRLEK